ncbi:MAG TPA: hypothetical protein V6D11_14365 [Waterburya sp.]
MRTEDVILYKSTHLTRVENQLLDFLAIALLILCHLARRFGEIDPKLQPDLRNIRRLAPYPPKVDTAGEIFGYKLS